MNRYFLFILLGTLISCQGKIETASTEKEIITTLKKETQYFCERNLEMWQAQWLQQDLAYKMYAGEHEFEEFVGWEEINQFTVQHIEKQPDPIPLPNTNYEFNIHLFGETAWVFYSKIVDDAEVRETRFMVKENGYWKIARMQTVF